MRDSDVFQEGGTKQKRNTGEWELQDLRAPQHLGAGNAVCKCGLCSACGIQAGMDMPVTNQVTGPCAFPGSTCALLC